MSLSAGFTCSGEDGNHVFGECRRRHDYSLPFLFPALAASVPVPGIGNFRSCSWRHDIKRTIFTATLLHCIERDDYINKAPCRFRVFPALPLVCSCRLMRPKFEMVDGMQASRSKFETCNCSCAIYLLLLFLL